MAAYRPHHISTWLCALLDSKRATVNEIADRLRLTPEYIERLANNPKTPVDGAVRLDLVRLIGSYHRRFPETRPPSEYEFHQRKLRLVEEAEEDERQGSLRGVAEEPDPPPGMRIFKSTTSRGAFVERREYLSANLSKQLVRRILLGMEAYLDVVEPVETTVTADN